MIYMELQYCGTYSFKIINECKDEIFKNLSLIYILCILTEIANEHVGDERTQFQSKNR